MNLKDSIIQNFKKGGIILLDQSVVSGTSFITGILLARFLGLHVYGVFALLWMVVLFGLSFSQAFITKPMQSFGPKMDQEESANYFSALHSLQFIFSLFAISLALIGFAISNTFSFFLLPSAGIIFKIPIILGLFLLYDYYRKFHFVKGDIKSALKLDGLLAITQITGIVLLNFYDILSLESLLSIIVLTYTLVCIVGFFGTVRPNLEYTALRHVFYKNLEFSKWLLGTALLQWLCGNFFIIAGGGILGAAVVGAIRIVQNIIGLTHVIFLAMENVVPVYAAKEYTSGGIEQLYSFLRKISIQTGSLVMMILVSLAALAPVIIELLYGQEYTEFSYILVSFCLIYLLVFIGHPLRFALRTLELTKPIFFAYVLGAVFSLISAYPLLFYFEIYGLLTGMFITQLISQLVYLFSLLKIKNAYEDHTFGTRQS